VERLRQTYDLNTPEDDEDDEFRYRGKDTRPMAKGVANFPRPEIESAGNPEDFPTEGEILGRVSTRSMFSKDWGQLYWVMDEHDLYLYRFLYLLVSVIFRVATLTLPCLTPRCKQDFMHPTGNGYKKKIHITHNLRCLKIHRKEYSGFGSMMNFMLEEVLDYGPVNVAKFASQDREQISALYEQLKAKIAVKRRERGF
jgi:hypothetical protein